MIICIEVSKGDNLKLSVGSDHRWEQCHQDRDYPNLKWIVRHMIFSNLSKSNLFVDRVWLPSMSMTQLIESNLSSKAYKSPQPAFFLVIFTSAGWLSCRETDQKEVTLSHPSQNISISLYFYTRQFCPEFFPTRVKHLALLPPWVFLDSESGNIARELC